MPHRRSFLPATMVILMIAAFGYGNLSLSVSAEFFNSNLPIENDISEQAGPSITIDNYGNIYAVWLDYRNDLSLPLSERGDIYFAKSNNDGISFNFIQKVSDAVDGTRQLMPSIALDSSGTIHVVWEDWRNDADGYWQGGSGGIDGIENGDIYYSNSTDGGLTWSSSMMINDDGSTTEQGRPDIAVDSNDVIHIVWNDKRRVTNFDIYYSNSTNGGINFSVNKKINDVSGAQASRSPAIAIDDDNNIHIAWCDYRNTGITGPDIYYANSTDGGITFSANKRVSDDTLDLYQYWPDIAVGGGIIGIVWDDDRENSLYFANSTDGGITFSVNKRVNSFVGGLHQSGSIAINSDGYMVVAWEGSGIDIYFANSTDGGSVFSPSQRVNDDVGANFNRLPSIAIRNRTVYVAWFDDRNSNYDIYFTRSNFPPSMAMPISPPNDSTLPDNTPTLMVTSVTDLDNDTIYCNFTISDQPDAESGTNYTSGWIDSTSWTAPILSDGKWFWHTYASDMWNTTTPNWIWNFTIDTTYADLEITKNDIVLNKSSPVDNGSLITINATIHNIGNVDASDVNVSFYDGNPASGGIQMGMNQTIALIVASGGVGWAEINNWIATPVGMHNIYVVVDADNSTIELDETNNMANRTIEIGDQDYIPWNMPPSQQKVSVGSSVLISSQVKNVGNINATVESTTALYNLSTPLMPFDTYTISPLNTSEISIEYNAMWTAPTIAGTYYVIIKADYYNDIDELDEGNNTYTIEFNVTEKPITTIHVGLPQFGAGLVYVTLSTEFSFSVVDNSGEGIMSTYYRIDATGGWVNYTSTGDFTISTEGEHIIYFNSTDNLGGAEDTNEFIIRADDTPPTTSIAISEPKYKGNPEAIWNVTSSTSFNLSAFDEDSTPIGVQLIEYRIDGSPSWGVYTQEFNLSTLDDGLHSIDYRGIDHLGNTEVSKTLVVNLDNIPPTTFINPEAQEVKIGTIFTLTAIDVGSDVNRIQYSIDNRGWTNYSTPFAIETYGQHTIKFRSVDNLGNIEGEKTLSIIIPEPEEYNWKPFMALIFTMILLIVGAVISFKKPLKFAENKNRIYAWMVLALPFAIAEIATGITSYLTGFLSIPPLLSIGMVVDLAILIIGLAVFIVTYIKFGKK